MSGVEMEGGFDGEEKKGRLPPLLTSFMEEVSSPMTPISQTGNDHMHNEPLQSARSIVSVVRYADSYCRI